MPSYSVGDYIDANCTSDQSNPPTELTWYINERKVSQAPYVVSIQLIILLFMVIKWRGILIITGLKLDYNKNRMESEMKKEINFKIQKPENKDSECTINFNMNK